MCLLEAWPEALLANRTPSLSPSLRKDLCLIVSGEEVTCDAPP
jgi:hypothetical protein